jgi:hypothetical protein
MFLLKSYKQPIPGNYFYVQTGTIAHQFAPLPFIEEIAKAVSSFRIANHLPRASLAESLEDVDQFNCAVRNNDPNLCFWCDGNFESARPQHHFVKKSCESCGTPIKN